MDFHISKSCEFRSKIVSRTTGSSMKSGIFEGVREICSYKTINWDLLITNLLELDQNSMSVFFNLVSKTSTDLTGHKPKFTMAVQPPRRKCPFRATIIFGSIKKGQNERRNQRNTQQNPFRNQIRCSETKSLEMC